MNFRTEVNILPSPQLIGYSTPVMFIGSCFAGEMAGKMKEGLMPVLSNPYGVVYNPFSVSAALRDIISGRIFTADDLWYYNNRWLSFSHHTLFSSANAEEVLDTINELQGLAGAFLAKASFLFVTFGTARIYRRKDSGAIVSNCHKIPSSFFESEMPGPAEICSDWNLLLDELHEFNPGLSVVFTVSPVRHWKDGAHGNQLSKSVLFIAIDELQKHRFAPSYFPSYEIMMDDLRDYRYYGEDMLHPSQVAVNYIWDKLSAAWIDSGAMELWREIAALTRAAGHRVTGRVPAEVHSFAVAMLDKIATLEMKNTGIDFSAIRAHFLELLQQ